MNPCAARSASAHHFSRGSATLGDGCNGGVASVSRVCQTHHVLRIEHPLRELRHSAREILPRLTRREWSNDRPEEMQPPGKDHIDSDLPQIAIQWPGEASASSDVTRHFNHQMIQVALGQGRERQTMEAQLAESFVGQVESLICVSPTSWWKDRPRAKLNDCIRNLQRRNDR